MKQLVALIAETDEEKANHNSTYNFVGLDGKLSDAGEALVTLAFEVLGKACFTNSRAHGWYEDYEMPDGLGQRNFGEVIGLIHSEVSEAFEAYRDGDVPQEVSYSGGEGWKWTGPQELTNNETGEVTLGKPEGVASEFADTVIRIADYVGAYSVPLGLAIIQKHRYNFTRPYRHGGKLA